jgi:hypothetical protein
MDRILSLQEQTTAGAQLIGFDYQFYYFMYLSLGLKYGEHVGFEVKDDVHIDRQDGTTVLFQMKHTVQTNAGGDPKNLTELDMDIWKTLGNWIDLVKVEKEKNDFLNKHHYCLVTNKNEVSDTFQSYISTFRQDSDLNKITAYLKGLKGRTANEEIKKVIDKILSVKVAKLRVFFGRLTIETGVDGIIALVKQKIHESVRQEVLVEPVFESLSSNMLAAKYTDIKVGDKFEISFQDFNDRFGKCFKVAFEKKPLPRRDFPFLFPEDPETQLFIVQLLDIGVLDKGSSKILDYTTHMLQALNQLSYWVGQNFVLPEEMEKFQRETLLIWENEFDAKYQQLKRKLAGGSKIEELEDEVMVLGSDLVHYLKRQDLKIENDTLGIELSNGHFYALSDSLQIGWRFDWKDKYKKI